MVLENQNHYPRGAQIIINDFYVDDLITGASNVNFAIPLRETVRNILNSGGFELRKICSNDICMLVDLHNPDNVSE